MASSLEHIYHICSSIFITVDTETCRPCHIKAWKYRFDSFSIDSENRDSVGVLLWMFTIWGIISCSQLCCMFEILELLMLQPGMPGRIHATQVICVCCCSHQRTHATICTLKRSKIWGNLHNLTQLHKNKKLLTKKIYHFMKQYSVCFKKCVR